MAYQTYLMTDNNNETSWARFEFGVRTMPVNIRVDECGHEQFDVAFYVQAQTENGHKYNHFHLFPTRKDAEAMIQRIEKSDYKTLDMKNWAYDGIAYGSPEHQNNYWEAERERYDEEERQRHGM